MTKLLRAISAFVFSLSSLAFLAVPAMAEDYYDFGDPDTTLDDYYTTGASDELTDEEAAAAASVFAGFGIFWVVFCCVWFLIAAALAYWVYSDAKKNGVENAALWGILTFIFGLIPLLIYFLAIRNKSKGGTTATK